MSKATPGAITISRITGGRAKDTIAIRIEDRVSGCEMIEFEMTPAAFVMAITGQGSVHGRIKSFTPGLYLKQWEVKTVNVVVPESNLSKRDAVAAKAVAAHEVDGWLGRVSDATNHHHYRGKSKDGRYVDLTPDQLAARIKELEARDES